MRSVAFGIVLVGVGWVGGFMICVGFGWLGLELIVWGVSWVWFCWFGVS